jgi:hypothetical protein
MGPIGKKSSFSTVTSSLHVVSVKPVDTGNALVKTFVGSALSIGKSGSFYGPIKRSNIKIFSDMSKKTKL